MTDKQPQTTAKVTNVEPMKGEYVEAKIPGSWNTSYVRYAHDSWEVRMGESLEPIYDEKEVKKLEDAYQDYMRLQNERI